jgi:hypothetical protein
MSILIVQVLPQGLVFGADRNVTVTTTTVEADGQVQVTLIQGQGQRPKVLKWPNNRALVGYVGAAQIAGMPMDEWLYEFIGRHFEFPSFENVAEALRAEVEQQRSIDEGEEDAQALILHLGGFERREDTWIPVVWFIRNTYSMKDGSYDDVRKSFIKSEEIRQPHYFGQMPASAIRERLKKLAEAHQPFWFHQGFDLGTFNTLEAFLRAAFGFLVEHHPGHSFPKTLEDWERHLRMAVLMYGAYFEAFKGPGEHYVGGGVDTVKLPWPH